MKVQSLIVNLNETSSLLDRIIKRLTLVRHFVEVGELDMPVFKDGETSPNFLTSVRGKRVYILTTANTPLKREQLYLTIDAAKRASACEIIPIMPYFPYARQDKKDQYRGPIGARVMADILENCGASSVITFDLHSDQIEGFFNISVIHLRGRDLFLDYVLKITDSNSVLCSPDAGGLKRVKKVRDLILEKHPTIKIPFISLDKTRPSANNVTDMEVLGDVENKDVLIIDDMCDTGGTLIKGAEALMEAGARSVRVMVTHGVLSGDASKRIGESPIKEFICSDSLVDMNNDNIMGKKLTVISTANDIANAILSINSDTSIHLS